MENSLGVVAKKIVSHLRFSLRWSTFFTRDLEQTFVIFCNTLNAGLPSFVFTRWWMQYMEGEQANHTQNEIVFESLYLLSWHAYSM